MKKPIKVIKVEDRERAKLPAAEAPVKVTKDPAREMIKTVSEWVRESRNKRNTNPKLAFEDLFAN